MSEPQAEYKVTFIQKYINHQITLDYLTGELWRYQTLGNSAKFDVPHFKSQAEADANSDL